MSLPHAPDFSLPASYSDDLQQALNRISRELTVLVDADTCLIYWVTADGLCIPMVASGSISEEEWKEIFSSSLDSSTDGLVEYVLNHHTPVVIDQVKQNSRFSSSILSMIDADEGLAVPVQGRNRIIGMVIAIRRNRTDPFTTNQINLTEAITGAIALALENVQMSQATRDRLLETQEVLQLVCTEAQRLTGAKGSSIGLVEGNEWLRVMYSAGEAVEKPGQIPLSQALPGGVVWSGEPLIINHPADHRGEITDGTPFSLLAIPLRIQGQIIGVLDVTNKKGGFTREDADLIELFANQAAMAVENARLAKQVQEMAVMEERYRLSRELHDSVNQLLYGMALYTKAARRKLKAGDLEAVTSHLRDLEESTGEALKEMRLLIFELRPSMLDEIGLRGALIQRLKTVEEQLGLSTNFIWQVDSQLDSKLEEMLYGVAQEALNNVVKHSGAKYVTLQVIQQGQILQMRVEDDGGGFVVEGKEGIGLRTMRERVRAHKAELSIQSAPGRGTTLSVEVKL
ncbi:MAG: GAF domain-containing sensor histidine kinase [Leptolinea sp.]|jgi:signal transduction histidine kinase|nr:GAF domain-containing sensor histidine kinase [Leptolinea sp.]